MVVILMGVTGTGKTTVGHALAQATGWPFADADDFHPEANKQKMHAGIPLTDADRAPWLAALHGQIVSWAGRNTNAILACSALRQSYRDTLSAGLPHGALYWIFLTGPAEVIRQRLLARHGHYMPASLLPSQLATLEPPHDAVCVDITQSVPAIVREILGALAPAMPGGAMLKEPPITPVS